MKIQEIKIKIEKAELTQFTKEEMKEKVESIENIDKQIAELKNRRKVEMKDINEDLKFWNM